jgi:hypothetical protein
MDANVPVKLTAVVVVPLQIAWLTGELAVGVGFTEIKNVETGPTHPFAVGVMIMVALMGAFDVFVAINEGMFTDPLDPRPIAVLLFVHVNVVPATGPVKGVVIVDWPLQNSSFNRLSIVGFGFTLITTFCE